MSPRQKHAVGWAAALATVILLTPIGPMAQEALIERPRLAYQRLLRDDFMNVEVAKLADCDSRVAPIPEGWSPTRGLTDEESDRLERASDNCLKGKPLSQYELDLANKASDLIWRQSYYCMNPTSDECISRRDPNSSI